MSHFNHRTSSVWALLALLMLAGGCQNNGTASQAVQTDADEPIANAAPVIPKNQKHFATPQEAVDGLTAALANNDMTALLSIVGSEYERLISSGDANLDAERRKEFADDMKERTELQKDGEDRLNMLIGNDKWPAPIPLVKDDQGWRFATEEGADEMINRRIGKNELAVIDVCHAYVAAQAEYARKDRDGDDVLEYAQKVRSTPGTKDGLYWPTEEGEPLSPLGLLNTAAQIAFPDRKEGDPFMGYYFRILNAQGDQVPGGRYNYIINGNMIAGFALVAWPAKYGSTGIMTFVINHQDKLYQKDLGQDTDQIASKMTEYNPDSTWKEVVEP
ncbi:MAG TPA: DUF2950 domain-containing protein [Tepidisphaeraceae bacterium]|jgi:hypothetical protein